MPALAVCFVEIDTEIYRLALQGNHTLPQVSRPPVVTRRHFLPQSDRSEFDAGIARSDWFRPF